MATRTIKTVFQVRRDSAANWDLYKDIVPAAGEPCYDLDRKTLRIGDGITSYANLPILSSVENAVNMQEAIDKLQEQIGETNVVEVHESVTNLTTQVNETNTKIVTIQETLDGKADAKTVEVLKTDLQTYIDEQIKTVESGNIDDGEI